MPIRERYQLDQVEGARVGRFNLGINTTFVVYRIGETLIDSGPSNQWSAVRRFVDEQPVNKLILSHHHEDHSGNAGRIAKHCNLLPIAPELGQRKLAQGYQTPLLQKVIWGNPSPVATQTLPEIQYMSDGSQLISVHTPGHAKDLHCFYLPEKGWLFTGDLYISKSLRYLRSDENLNQLITSIRKVLALDFEVIFCAHRGILNRGKQALTEKLNNIIGLCLRAQALQQKGQELDQIVMQLLGPEGMMARLTSNNFCKANLIAEALKVPPASLSAATL